MNPSFSLVNYRLRLAMFYLYPYLPASQPQSFGSKFQMSYNFICKFFSNCTFLMANKTHLSRENFLPTFPQAAKNTWPVSASVPQGKPLGSARSRVYWILLQVRPAPWGGRSKCKMPYHGASMCKLMLAGLLPNNWSETQTERQELCHESQLDSAFFTRNLYQVLFYSHLTDKKIEACDHTASRYLWQRPTRCYSNLIPLLHEHGYLTFPGIPCS